MLCPLACCQVQEKLATRMMEEEQRRMYDTIHEAEHRRMETRCAAQPAQPYSAPSKLQYKHSMQLARHANPCSVSPTTLDGNKCYGYRDNYASLAS